jgi:translocation and assembly module TamB
VGVVWIGWQTLRYSDDFARWALEYALQDVGDSVSIGEMSGSLAEGLSLRDIRLRSPVTDIAVGQVDTVLSLSLMPARITIESALVRDVVTRISAEAAKPDAADEPFSLNDLTLPIAVQIRSAEIQNFVLMDESGIELLELDDISFSGDWHESIETLQLAWQGQDLQGSISGTVSLQAPYAHQLNASVSHPSLEGTAEASLAGNARATQLSASAAAWGVDLTGELKDVFDQPSGALEFTLDEFELPMDQAESLHLSAVSGTISGRPGKWTLSAQGIAAGFGLEGMELILEGQGAGVDASITTLRINGDAFDARLSGELTWPLSDDLEFDMVLARLDPALWVPEWPAGKALMGNARVSVNAERFSLDGLTLTMADTEFQLNGAADVDLESEQLRAQLEWSALAWPPAPVEPWFTSSTGSIKLDGKMDDWSAKALFHLELAGYPGGEMVAQANGGRTFGTLEIVTAEGLGGRFQGFAEADWSDDFRYAADLGIQEVQLRHLFSDWPAVLSGQLRLEHDPRSGRMALQIDELVGHYQGIELTASGGLELLDDSWRVDQLRVASADSHLFAHGSLYGQEGLAFEIHAERPDKLAEWIGGRLSGRGRLALAAVPPVIDVDLQGEDLAWGDFRISRLSASSAEEREPGALSLAVTAEQLEWRGHKFDRLEASVGGDDKLQTLAASLSHDDWRITALANGSVLDWQNLPDFGWQGRLQLLELVDDVDRYLILSKPSALAFSTEAWSLQDTCLDVLGGGSLCLTARREDNGRLYLQSRANQLPLQASQLLLEHNIAFTQSLNGQIELEAGAGLAPSGFARLIISEGSFGDQSDGDVLTRTGKGVIGFEIRDGDLLSGQIDLPIPGVGEIDTDFAVTGLALDGTGQLSGRLSVQLDTLSVLESFTTSLDGVDGRVQADFELGGRTGDPAVSGTFDLSNGQAEYPLFGTRLSEISLHAEVSEGDFLYADGRFQASEGSGEVSMALDFEDLDNPTVSLTLEGDGLKLLDAPETEAWFDLDLQADWQSPTWQLGGTVHIPRGQLSAQTTVLSKISESPDVTVIAGTPPPRLSNRAAEQANLSGGLKLSLGDSVILSADVADLTVGGEVEFNWQEQLVPNASGDFVLNGEIRAFGPVLRVERGRVRFPDVPANNPVLDIRAERDIFGNTAIRAAGVAVTGPARRPEIEAYTQPLTTRERAWGLLITGRDFDVGQGVGALDVGTYIAPRIFVAYGVSLFDDDNVISARFDLRRGFGVKATSGQRETGLDMSYTVDR